MQANFDIEPLKQGASAYFIIPPSSSVTEMLQIKLSI